MVTKLTMEIILQYIHVSNHCCIPETRGSLVAQMVKDLPVMQEMQETQVQSLGREDPLEKRMATHPSILAWKIPWTKEPCGL